MNKYNVEIVIKHTFIVEADTLEQAEIEAQDFDEYFADTTIEKFSVEQDLS